MYTFCVIMYEEETFRKTIKEVRMEIVKTWRQSRYMDKRICESIVAATCGNKRKHSKINTEDSTGTILIWKDGKYWIIYDQNKDVITQGTSYEDAIFMLSDAIKELRE